MRLKVSRGVQALKVIRSRGRSSLNVLPNLFTVGNLVAGVLAIIFAAKEEPVAAAWLIVLAVIFDGLDGRVARLLRTDGEFGRQLDSLADVVSFGTAPALIMYYLYLKGFGIYGLAVTVLLPVTGALRLARFNILRISGHFVGLPITASGGLIASLVLYGGGLDAAAAPALMLLLSYLMVSTIPFPDFKKLKGFTFRPLQWVLPVLAAALALRADLRTIIVLPLALYAASGPYLLLLRQWERSVIPRLRFLHLRGE